MPQGLLTQYRGPDANCEPDTGPSQMHLTPGVSQDTYPTVSPGNSSQGPQSLIRHGQYPKFWPLA